MPKATFGLFDHIEDMPGTPPAQLLQDRLDLIELADQAGFACYHLAEHHGSDLCLAPNQEVFLAAAAAVTENIHLGPMVKLLPLHHPIRVFEDMATLDVLSKGRVEFGVGRGVAPIEHYWFDGDWPHSREKFDACLEVVIGGLKNGVLSSADNEFYDFPDMPVAMFPYQRPNPPFWYPGNPEVAGKYGMNLMWPGPIDEESYGKYVDAWDKYKGDELRVDRPDAQPRVGATMITAIAHDRERARDIARRGMDGLIRRAHNVHAHDIKVMSAEKAEAALDALNRIMEHQLDAVENGAGSPQHTVEQFGAILESTPIDYIVLQLPTGDMTLEESRTTMDLFIEHVMPEFA